MQDLDTAEVSAALDLWMTVTIDGYRHLFGFADQHAATGGLSWMVSSPVIELTETRARTASGRVYSLRKKIDAANLNDEGQTALRLLVTHYNRDYTGRAFDRAWVVTQKMARHLQVEAPPRDPEAVERFLETHETGYVNLRNKR